MDEYRIHLGKTDSADPKVLTSYASWAVRNYPAERYALVLWSHGSGWDPSEMDRAAYAALDGSEVLSDIITIRVRYPVTAADEALADLFMGEDQGTLLYLLGSDDESLKRGNEAVDEVLEKHAKHPMANYVRLVKGVNASRDFKTVTEEHENRVVVRKAKLDESAKANALSAVSHAMAQAGDREGLNRALAVAGAIENKSHKASVLSAGCQAMVQAGDLSAAIQVLRNALCVSRLTGRESLFKVLESGAGLMGRVDNGQALWKMFEAVQEADGWWSAS